MKEGAFLMRGLSMDQQLCLQSRPAAEIVSWPSTEYVLILLAHSNTWYWQDADREMMRLKEIMNSVIGLIQAAAPHLQEWCTHNSIDEVQNLTYPVWHSSLNAMTAAPKRPYFSARARGHLDI